MASVVSLDLAAALGAPDRCPRCGRRTLVGAPVDDRMVFTCPACSRAWVVEQGLLLPLEPPG